MVAVGLALAAGLGTIASVLREQQPALTFAVFSMTLLPACLGVSWLIFVAGHTTAPPEHAAEGVETNWLQRATSEIGRAACRARAQEARRGGAAETTGER